MQGKYNIKLTKQQNNLFNTLMNYHKQLHLTTIMRVAGGWVRDKIMGLKSDDIDIALDNMKGQEFVMKIKLYTQQNNLKDKISAFGVTKFNPQLSKHLQTATAKLHGYSIDFVNLRSQKYSQQSRIPNIVSKCRYRLLGLHPKMPSEETLLSIEIEDWTQLGIADIHNKILRTPIDPYQTFKDDPLRILRCFRFRSRFNFVIDPLIYKALQCQQIKQYLRNKVSKQRIGKQLYGLLKSQYLLLGLKEILNYNLWNIIFQLPPSNMPQQLLNEMPLYSYNLLQQFLQTNKDLHFQLPNQKLPENTNKSVLTALAGLCLIYRGYLVKGKAKQPLVQSIIKNSLKYPSKIAKYLVQACNSVSQAQKLLKNVNKPTDLQIIKWIFKAEQKWQLALIFFHIIVRIQKTEPILLPFELRQYILQNKLDKAYLMGPFIDGKYVGAKGKSGPIVKTILDNSVYWRVMHPQATKEQFIALFGENIQLLEDQSKLFK